MKMALFNNIPVNYSILSIQFQRNSIIPKPSTIKPPKISTKSIANFSKTTAQTPNYCCLSSTSETTHLSPPNIIFVKGLPLSISEASMTAFSQFGEVTRVKIVTDKKTRKSLGFAYVWLANKDDAEMAAKEMNGKFIDGRFVSVKMAVQGSCKTQAKTMP